MRVVEVGQYFVTKDTGDFRQFRSVACREFSLPRDDPTSQPKGWIQRNMRIGSVLEVTTNFQHFKNGIKIRIKSVNQNDSHSWVRISYGMVKYVNDFIEDNTEIPADPQEEQVSQTSTSVVAARSKAKAKPKPRESTGMTTVPFRERNGLILNHQSKISNCTISRRKSLIFFDTIRSYIEKKMEQFKFCKNKIPHQSQIQNWSDDRWKICLAASGRSKRRYQCCFDNLGSIICLCAFQGHSGSNLIDPALQDNVLIGPRIFPTFTMWEAGSSKPTQFPKPIEDRPGKPVTQEIVGKLQEKLSSSDRSGQSDREEEKRVRNHDGLGQLVEGRLCRGNLLREDCTKCKKMVFSKIVMARISSTLWWMTRTLISTSAQHSTAQHNTAQHSTTQHNTAQHNTTQHSTVLTTDRRNPLWTKPIKIQKQVKRNPR